MIHPYPSERPGTPNEKTMRYTLLLLFAILAGCSAKVQVHNQTSYADAAFSKASIEEHGLAILPVVAGEGVEGYRRPFGQSLNQVGAVHLSSGSLLTWEGAMEAINNAGLVSEYNAAIASYQQTSIIDRTLVGQMSEATGTRYFLYVTLFPPTSDTSVNYSVISGGLRTDQRLGVSAFGQVWDAEGDVAWEGTGSSEVQSNEFQSIDEAGEDFSIHSNNAARALFRAVLGLEPEEN